MLSTEDTSSSRCFSAFSLPLLTSLQHHVKMKHWISGAELLPVCIYCCAAVNTSASLILTLTV